jgi:hypothetical protein
LLAPVSIRAVSTVIFFLFVNIIGLGLGPTRVGVVRGMLVPRDGVFALRVGPTIVKPSFVYSA